MKRFLVLAGLWGILSLPSVAETANGSGFVVRGDGYVVTCAHVVADAKRITARVNNRTQELQVVRADTKRDLALLHGKERFASALPLAPVVRPGMESYALGYPLPAFLGELLKITHGIISGFFMDGTQKRLHTDTPFSPGNSGGALVDNRGRLLGVTAGRFVGMLMDGTGVAVSVDDVRALLGESKVVLPEDTAVSEKMDGEQLYEKLAPATAFITVELGSVK